MLVYDFFNVSVKRTNNKWPGTVYLNWFWGYLSIRKMTFPLKISRLIKHCKSLLSSAKWETTKGNQLSVYRARSLFSDLLETSIDYSPTSCLLPLCKTIEKMEKGNNKKSDYLFPSFLPFCPFSRTSALRLMFYLWNCQSCRGGHNFFLNAQIVSIRKNKTHKFFMAHEKQSCKVNNTEHI